MGRRRALKNIKKEAYWVTKAKEKGRLQAATENWQKQPFDKKILDVLKPLIDKIDPLELVAVVAGTFVVHDLILTGQDFVTEVTKFVARKSEGVIEVLLHSLGVPSAAEVIDTEVVMKQIPDFGDGAIVWLISFGVSFMVVRHGGDMLGTARMFFGLGK